MRLSWLCAAHEAIESCCCALCARGCSCARQCSRCRALLGAGATSALCLLPTGDLNKPSLGLDPEVYARLAAEVDTVVHNGALVNHAYSYQQQFEPNVLGTVEVRPRGIISGRHAGFARRECCCTSHAQETIASSSLDFVACTCIMTTVQGSHEAEGLRHGADICSQGGS